MRRRTPLSRLDVQSDLRASRHVGVWVREALSGHLAVADWRMRAQMELAVHEAWTNIVEHAYRDLAGTVTVTACRVGHDVVFQLFDTGRQFDPRDVPDPVPEAGQVGGYGLSIMRSVMDRITYDQTRDGNRWRLVKSLASSV